MALRKVTLLKAWTHPTGIKFKAGETFRVLDELYQELKGGGYISVPKAAKSSPKKSK